MIDESATSSQTLPEPPPELKAVIEAGMAARGWIVNSYAQFENMLSDLVRLARQLPEYSDLHVPFRTAKRISCVRELLEREGPLKKFKAGIGPLIDQFEGFEDPRLLLVHGFTKVYHTPKNEIGFSFEVFRQTGGGEAVVHRKMYRPDELEAEHKLFVDFAQTALLKFQEIHHEMGWIAD